MWLARMWSGCRRNDLDRARLSLIGDRDRQESARRCRTRRRSVRVEAVAEDELSAGISLAVSRRPAQGITSAHPRRGPSISHDADRPLRPRARDRCYLIGFTGDITRFASRDHYAAYNGTAPVARFLRGPGPESFLPAREPATHRALYLAVICQIRQPHSEAACTSTAESPTGRPRKQRSAALKRQISNAVYRQLLIDADRRRRHGWGGQQERLCRRA